MQTKRIISIFITLFLLLSSAGCTVQGTVSLPADTQYIIIRHADGEDVSVCHYTDIPKIDSFIEYFNSLKLSKTDTVPDEQAYKGARCEISITTGTDYLRLVLLGENLQTTDGIWWKLKTTQADEFWTLFRTNIPDKCSNYELFDEWKNGPAPTDPSRLGEVTLPENISRISIEYVGVEFAYTESAKIDVLANYLTSLEIRPTRIDPLNGSWSGNAPWVITVEGENTVAELQHCGNWFLRTTDGVWWEMFNAGQASAIDDLFRETIPDELPETLLYDEWDEAE